VGGSDVLAIDAVAATGSLRTLGTGATQAAAGNDARFTEHVYPNRSSFFIYKSASSQVHNTPGNYVQITYDVESYDSKGEAASSEFVAQAAGDYIFHQSLYIPAATAGNYVAIALYINGGNAGRIVDYIFPSSAGIVLPGSINMRLAAGASVKIYMYHDNVTSLTISTGSNITFFKGIRVA
jgi:hypothetical protein